MKRRILSPTIPWMIAGSLFTILLMVTAALPTLAQEKPTDWTLDTATGETVNFHETLEKGPVVINFWATWCKPCLKEMPQMNRLAGEYAGRVTFMAINADASKALRGYFSNIWLL